MRLCHAMCGADIGHRPASPRPPPTWNFSAVLQQGRVDADTFAMRCAVLTLVVLLSGGGSFQLGMTVCTRWSFMIGRVGRCCVRSRLVTSHLCLDAELQAPNSHSQTSMCRVSLHLLVREGALYAMSSSDLVCGTVRA